MTSSALPEFFASPAAAGTCAAVLSLTKAGYHRYAMSGTESALTAAGWTLEGPAFYARNNTAPAPAPDPAPAPVDPTADTEFAFAVMPDTQDEAYGTFGSDQGRTVSYPGSATRDDKLVAAMGKREVPMFEMTGLVGRHFRYA